MYDSFMMWMDIIGTIAFAISGAMTAIKKDMDIFGVNILALTTAVGGGCIRDVLIGKTPPQMFRNPMYVMIALMTGNVVFLILYSHKLHADATVTHIYELALFWCDTLGLASFAVNGTVIGIQSGPEATLFLEVFLGVLSGVGGGILRDMMAMEMSAVFVKHVYAVACIVGSLLVGLLWGKMLDDVVMLIGFLAVVFVRFMAAEYHWNLPRV